MREDDSAHITAIGNEAGRFTETKLQSIQRLTHRWKQRDPGCLVSDLFGTNCGSDVFLSEKYLAASKLAGQMRCQLGKCMIIIQWNIFAQRTQGDQAVQRSGVKIMKTEPISDQMRDRPLTRCSRPVNRDYRNIVCAHFRFLSAVCVVLYQFFQRVAATT